MLVRLLWVSFPTSSIHGKIEMEPTHYSQPLASVRKKEEVRFRDTTPMVNIPFVSASWLCKTYCQLEKGKRGVMTQRIKRGLVRLKMRDRDG